MALSLLNAKKILFLPYFSRIQTSNFFHISSLKMANGIVQNVPTAGIIIIGNEILHGEVQDTNSYFLASKLYKLGIKLCKISVVADDRELIANEVASFSKLYTHVITTGGIGPTHDDITFESVAAAFNENIKTNIQIVKLIQDWYKTDDMNSPAMKMAKIPESSRLHFGESRNGVVSKYPVVSVKNIFIFPGIPHLLRKSFDILAEDLFKSQSRFNHGNIYLTEGEVELAPILDDAVQQFPAVTIGSYPELFHSYYKTKITMDSLTNSIDDVKTYITSKVNKESIVKFNPDTISQPWVHIEELCRNSAELAEKVEEAKSCIYSCFEKYDLDSICLCYNGGKDCLAVLHLCHAIVRHKFPGKRLQAVYITEQNPFPQLDNFIQQSIKRYDLDCDIIPGPIKPGLSELLKRKPAIKAVIMGTRRGDPYSDSLSSFNHTDKDWPSMMRVNPIIYWKYNHVWKFLRGLYLPYCHLYDMGYTSIGGQENTLPNPYLKSTNKQGQSIYLPAYLLLDGEHERKGRLAS